MAVALACGAGVGFAASAASAASPSSAMRITSSAFASGQRLPNVYTCKGKGVSPPLHFSGVPAGAKQLAVVLTDSDAPGGTFTHWTLYSLSAHLHGLSAGKVPGGARQGTNDFGRLGYGAPCPPRGKVHHYTFTLYALKRDLTLKARARPAAARSAIAAASTQSARLIGLFSANAPKATSPNRAPGHVDGDGDHDGDGNGDS